MLTHIGKPKVAVHKFSSCDGCQLAFINDAVALLELNKLVDIVHFAEAGYVDEHAMVDIAFIEGSINTKHDINRIKTIRDNSKYLIAIGACALTGGIQSLRNFTTPEEFQGWIKDIYPQETNVIAQEELDTAKGIYQYVKVDFSIAGCPVSSEQVYAATRQLLFGVEPTTTNDSVCTSCKHRGVSCVMVAHGEPCLGPVTADGCNALCPAIGRGCYGCYGSAKFANYAALEHQLMQMGLSKRQVMHKLHFINSQDIALTVSGEQK